MANRATILEQDYYRPNFLFYYVIDCPYEINSDEILQILRRHDEVELAYLETGAVLPPSAKKVSNSSSIYQGYLKPAPAGIDAVYAWNMEGGDGSGIKFIDIEQGWNLDSRKFTVKRLPCTGLNFSIFKNHGEAVLGVIFTKHDYFGCKGIAPKANGYVISQWRSDGSFNTADAIMAAISQLKYGDIILLEAQIYDYPGSESFWPVEIQHAVFDVIRLASALGIIVIEAAGNGKKSYGEGIDLDNFTDYHVKNPLNRKSPDFRDSGAILVAAASDSVPHYRIRHSNFGSRVDCYAWGERVSTEKSNLDIPEMAIHSYRKKINGTSSASAIIAGVAVLVQSITESNYHFRLSPKQMRGILGNDLLGTSSANGRSIDQLGVMPDLKKIIDYIHLVGPALNETDKTIHESNYKKNIFSNELTRF
ncbi:MAG TPA: S8 family serine peptidase [Puia sp.]|nr:S8 family serine peptidase [Puia sp.]